MLSAGLLMTDVCFVSLATFPNMSLLTLLTEINLPKMTKVPFHSLITVPQMTRVTDPSLATFTSSILISWARM